MESLPIQSIIPGIQQLLREDCRLVIEAPPGAGKTTVVPLALIDEDWLTGKSIVMLEPRRLAARSAACRMATLLNERVGQTVGYRVRHESKVSKHTRIEVVTEGILTRRIQADPELNGVGLLIFDEFHERNLHADLGLALALDCQSGLRPDLRIAIMSATLNASVIASRLNTGIISCEGRCYPVDTFYSKDIKPWDAAKASTRAVVKALHEHEGSILVFLPGAGEIRSAVDTLADQDLGSHILLAPLYGNLSLEKQNEAIRPAPAGQRKVVLATTIAETSITIQDVSIVIDSGLMRTSRFDPNSGMTRLETLRVTKASADQRRGRAGRTGPGICYRLWSENTQNALETDTKPELFSADLSTVVLELANWGVTRPADLTWLDQPPAPAWREGLKLLLQLEAIDEDGRITPHGKAMLRLGVHPRLAHMLIRAKAQGRGALASYLAALVSERDIMRHQAERIDCSILSRLDALLHNSRIPGYTIDKRGRQRVLELARETQNRLGLKEKRPDTGAAGQLLAWAYPDRIGRRRPNSELNYLLANGRGASLAVAQSLSRNEFIVAVDVDGAGRNAKIYLAAPIDLEDIMDLFCAQLAQTDTVEWDSNARAVQARRTTMLGSIILKEKRMKEPAADKLLSAMLTGIRELGINALNWTKESTMLRQRIAFLHRTFADDWPDVSDGGLMQRLADWLGPFIQGVTRFDQLSKIDLRPTLMNLLDWQQQRKLDQLAPTHCRVPSGANIRLDYSGDIPVLPARIQQMFGLMQTPKIAGDRVALLIHLLSPASRPVQVTQDLASFWENTYDHVKKELKGRYPKHHWPDNPRTAAPTNRVKPR